MYQNEFKKLDAGERRHFWKALHSAELDHRRRYCYKHQNLTANNIVLMLSAYIKSHKFIKLKQ